MNKNSELYSSVKKNDKYGFYELKDQYRKQMKDFYQDEYYQEERAAYRKVAYDELDMKHKRFFYAQKLYVCQKWGGYASSAHSFLDIGAGEGYALAYFAEKGWDVVGIDFSSYGMEVHNPAMLVNLRKGDFYEIVKQLGDANKQFDYINADNLLEHLPKPEIFFDNIKQISHKGTIVAITVPNDFSRIQQLAYNMGRIDSAFWVTTETSEHFNYFSAESLSQLGEDSGFEKIVALADWPIDFFLLHENTNYRKDSSAGHGCHVACAELENSLYEESLEKAVNLFRALAEAGIGREISIYFRMR